MKRAQTELALAETRHAVALYEQLAEASNVVTAKKDDANWTGSWTIEIPALVSDGT